MNKPHTDLSLIVAIKDASLFKNIHILKDWPDITTIGLKATALKQVLIKRLIIIQGPLGTRKTWL